MFRFQFIWYFEASFFTFSCSGKQSRSGAASLHLLESRFNSRLFNGYLLIYPWPDYSILSPTDSSLLEATASQLATGTLLSASSLTSWRLGGALTAGWSRMSWVSLGDCGRQVNSVFWQYAWSMKGEQRKVPLGLRGRSEGVDMSEREGVAGRYAKNGKVVGRQQRD